MLIKELMQHPDSLKYCRIELSRLVQHLFHQEYFGFRFQALGCLGRRGKG